MSKNTQTLTVDIDQLMMAGTHERVERMVRYILDEFRAKVLLEIEIARDNAVPAATEPPPAPALAKDKICRHRWERSLTARNEALCSECGAFTDVRSLNIAGIKVPYGKA